MVEIDSFYIGLRKINAIRMRKLEDMEYAKEKFAMRHQIRLGLKLEKEKKISITLFYRLTSTEVLDIEMDAEFIGHVEINEPFDIKDNEDITKSQQVKNFVETVLSPMMLKEIDKILSTIYNFMNIEYNPIIINGESHEENKTQKL